MNHTHRVLDVPVDGGMLRVGVWDPIGERTADVLAVHGVTASHLAWQFVAEALAGVRVIAPDLRGRGRSNALPGAGLAAHADDLAAVLEVLEIERTVVLGHSMGAFVAVVFADRHPERVTRLVLIDGGVPLDAPDLPTEQLVSAILGPTATRLGMRFADIDAYLDFWRQHPAFRDAWTPELERYLEYDLVADADGVLRPATTIETTAVDTADLVGGEALPAALARLGHPTILITVPRGLQDEEPGLYAPEHLDLVLERYPGIRAVRLDEFNHYTIVMSAAGARLIAPLIQAELAAES